MAVSKYYRIEEANQEIGNIEIHSQVFEVIAHITLYPGEDCV